MPESLHGLGVSPGVATGPVARMATPPAVPPDAAPGTDLEAEVVAAEQALDAVAASLQERADRAPGDAAEVLGAQVLMAQDPAQRVADLDDLRNRAVAVLLGVAMPGIPDPGHPYVLVAEDLAPADTATLDADQVLAIVTEKGGPTSGADKPLAFVTTPDEPNPALGVRGLRTSRRHPELLEEQLRAIAAAAQDSGADGFLTPRTGRSDHGRLPQAIHRSAVSARRGRTHGIADCGSDKGCGPRPMAGRRLQLARRFNGDGLASRAPSTR